MSNPLVRGRLDSASLHAPKKGIAFSVVDFSYISTLILKSKSEEVFRPWGRMSDRYLFTFNEIASARIAYHNLGFCVISDVVRAEQIKELREIYAETQKLADQGQGDPRWFDDETAWEQDQLGNRIVRKVPKPFESSSAFRRVFASEIVLDLVSIFIGPEIYLHSSKMLFKPPRVGRAKPMHQDLAYWTSLRARQVALWLPLNDVNAENGCMSLLPREHLKGLQPHYDLDDWQIAPDTIESEEWAIEMSAGDALFIHPLAPHASLPNRSDRKRLAAIVNYYAEPIITSDGQSYGSAKPLRKAEN